MKIIFDSERQMECFLEIMECDICPKNLGIDSPCPNNISCLDHWRSLIEMEVSEKPEEKEE